MNGEPEELDGRERDIDERERALLEREEEFAQRARADRADTAGAAFRGPLDRPPSVVAESPRRRVAFLFAFLVVVAALGWLILRGGADSDPQASAEALPFESRSQSSLDLEVPTTSTPLPGIPSEQQAPAAPVQAVDQIRMQEQELLFARQRAPILITQGPAQPPRNIGNAHEGRVQAFSVSDFPASPSVEQLLAMNGSAAGHTSRPQMETEDPNSRYRTRLGDSPIRISAATQTGDRNFLVLQGKFIDAVTETAINSDLPGQVRALVSYDVYAESGRRVMLPRGTRLIGEYNTAITKGQERLFVVWTRAIRPDGIDVALLSGASDPLGRAGLSGRVDTHFWTIFGTSALLSIIGAGTATAGVGAQDQLNSAAIYRAEVAQAFNESAGRVLDKYLDIKPTIRVENGEKVKVFVARDLDFSAALAALEPSEHIKLIR